MAEGGMRRFFAPVGIALVIVGVAEAVITFLLLLLAVTGEFTDRIVDATDVTALPLVVGGAALFWLGR